MLDGGPVEPALLAAMIEPLRHRGPDDIGYWTKGATGFGHTRLSIIDVTASRQPMASPDGSCHVTFNGEILNYRALRRQVDYSYRTSGDTEVLLALYQRYGADGVTQLRGQFAYALDDESSGSLHLVRDRLGILPLYYYLDDRVFAFASEIKALLPVLADVRVDTDSLHDYLAHRFVPAPFTLLAGVRKVPQGHRLELHRCGRLELHRYWTVPNEPTLVCCGAGRAVELVRSALERSIEEALVADVEVGAYLSGGLDSSLITALMVGARGSGQQVRTYTAGFGDPRMDELSWARRVARSLGTKHTDVVVTVNDFARLWPKLSWYRDAPLSEPADVAVFRLAELARHDVKVVLSGEGSDELFGGYPKYRFATATRWVGLAPAAPRSALLRRLERALPAQRWRLSVALRAASGSSGAERMRGWFAPFTERERAELLGRVAERSSLDVYQRARGDSLRRMLYADTHGWLADNLLERGDRMSMAASLEQRPPFLDHRLVELAFALPSSVKVHRGVTKWVIKQVARQLLPTEIVDRRKIGFRVPLDVWFRGGLKEMAFDLLLGSSSFVTGVFDRNVVQALLSGHDAGARNEQSRLWTLLSLEVWHREVIGGHRALALD